MVGSPIFVVMISFSWEPEYLSVYSSKIFSSVFVHVTRQGNPLIPSVVGLVYIVWVLRGAGNSSVCSDFVGSIKLGMDPGLEIGVFQLTPGLFSSLCFLLKSDLVMRLLYNLSSSESWKSTFVSTTAETLCCSENYDDTVWSSMYVCWLIRAKLQIKMNR